MILLGTSIGYLILFLAHLDGKKVFNTPPAHVQDTWYTKTSNNDELESKIDILGRVVQGLNRRVIILETEDSYINSIK